MAASVMMEKGDCGAGVQAKAPQWWGRGERRMGQLHGAGQGRAKEEHGSSRDVATSQLGAPRTQVNPLCPHLACFGHSDQDQVGDEAGGQGH